MRSAILNFFLVCCLIGMAGLPVVAQQPRLDAKGELMNMDELDLSSMAQPVPENNRFIDSAYNIWCGSVIKAENGKYYMFYSRWPKSEGHGAWITHSEIALARADRPEGPYKHLKVVFKARGKQFWDGVCTHNPAAIVHNGKYYLYYMGATGTAEIKKGFDYSPAWYNYRNNQRIGVAVANDPEGEWKRFDKPVLDVSKDSSAYDAMMVSNPAITVDQNGRAILVYKQVERNGTYRGGRVRYGVAFSKSIMGPFSKHPQPIFEDKLNPNAKEWMIAEDPFIWSHKGTNYAIVRDVIGKFTGSSGGLALFSSKNGIDWSPAKHPKVLSKDVYAENGSRFDDKLERPCLLLEKGLPTYLFGAMGIDKRKHSMNVAVPLKWQDALEKNFTQPSVVSKPYVWWHWMGSNFSKEGITKDLEAMKEMGIGGATIFNIASAVQESHFPILNNPWPNQAYRSPAYWEAIRHAAAEAKRLGLEIGLHNTAGYSTTGGPWITEEKGMQRTVVSTIEVEGGKPLKIQLVKPEPPIFMGWGSPKIKPSFYKDIAVLAIASKAVITNADIIDVTSKMNSDGLLEWTPPPGKWTIYRYGHAPTMANPHPLPDDIIGKSLEVDKMSAVQNEFHWKTVLDPLKEHVGDYLGTSFKHLLIDSYEADFQNWTPAFRDEFIKRKGYDPVPWLPVFEKDKNGKFLVINSEEQTARFKWDFKDVVNRLFFENGWNKGKEMIKNLGLQLQFEPYTGPFDIVEGAALADIPMGEFWTHRGGIQAQIPPAARAAGKTIIGAEAFTGRPEVSQYTEDPAFLKPTTVQAFAAGVNRLILHTWVHQPFDDKYQPGMSMGWWGTHFGRHQTWAKPGKAYFDFLGRAQSLLQYGETSADYLCLEKPEGIRSDVIATNDFLLQQIQVKNGKIVLPSGRAYPFLYLPNATAILPDVLKKIQSLVAAGAVVVGTKPLKSSSLQNYPVCDSEVASIANQLWSDAGVKQYGKGFVYTDLATALQRINIISPVTIESIDTVKAIQTLHRHGKDADVFLLVNLSKLPKAVSASFGIKGMQPELWDAEEGSIINAPVWRVENGRTHVQLFLKDYQTVFVVFRKSIQPNASHATKMDIKAGENAVEFATTPNGKSLLVASAKVEAALHQNNQLTKFNLDQPAKINLEGPWLMQFKPKLDKPFDTTFSTLIDFSLSLDDRIKYFSGTVKYLKEYNFSPSQLNGEKRIHLDLGELHDIVSLKVNGKSVGVDWHPPYEYDITDLLKSGTNLFELDVTNNWANRLIGDEQAPADFESGADRGNKGRAMKAFPDWFIKDQPRPSQDRKAFLLWYYHRKDSKLNPAGMIGPVQLIFKSYKQL